VLLHGGHGSWMHWLRNAEALSAERTLWLPDMPGFNESDAPPRVAPGEDSLPPLLAALGGTLDQLIGAGTPIDLGGFSFGGLTAARFAVQRGAVRRLALVGSGGHGSMRRMTAQMINWRAAPDREAERAALLNNLAALMLHDKAAIDALAFEIHDISCHGTRFRSKEVSQSGGLRQGAGHAGRAAWPRCCSGASTTSPPTRARWWRSWRPKGRGVKAPWSTGRGTGRSTSGLTRSTRGCCAFLPEAAHCCCLTRPSLRMMSPHWS
jgi:pimeloyl-ACP methyl ester carboxylesterase